MFDDNNVAVLDLTHAGIIIAKKLRSLGSNVTAIDVYRTVDNKVLSDLESESGINVSKEPVKVDDFDLIISPAHLDPAYPMLADAKAKGIEIMTHHRAVGIILSMNDSLADAKVIEITGSKAKTSSASLLAEMLSMKLKVVLHTSRGLELWDQGNSTLLNLGLSIAPGSILLAVDKLTELGVKADCYIFEVSIGLTGFANIGIITTLEPDYPIAASTSNSSDAKTGVLSYARPEEVFFLNVNDKKAQDMANEYDQKFLTFGDSEYSGINFKQADLVADLNNENIIFTHQKRTFSSELSRKYNSGSYATAFAVSTSVSLWMGVSEQDIIKVISSFEGLQGRMQEKELSGRILLDNSNSGMDIRSAERSLDYALSMYAADNTGVIMVLGEEAAQVCEGLPPDQVSEFAQRRSADVSKLILVGERMQGIGGGKFIYATGLEKGLEMAAEIASQQDIILSCVKCFR